MPEDTDGLIWVPVVFQEKVYNLMVAMAETQDETKYGLTIEIMYIASAVFNLINGLLQFMVL